MFCNAGPIILLRLTIKCAGERVKSAFYISIRNPARSKRDKILKYLGRLFQLVSRIAKYALNTSSRGKGFKSTNRFPRNYTKKMLSTRIRLLLRKFVAKFSLDEVSPFEETIQPKKRLINTSAPGGSGDKAKQCAQARIMQLERFLPRKRTAERRKKSDEAAKRSCHRFPRRKRSHVTASARSPR